MTPYDRLRSELMNKRVTFPPSSVSFAAELRHFDQRVDRMRMKVKDHADDAMMAMAVAIWRDHNLSAVDRLGDLVRRRG